MHHLNLIIIFDLIIGLSLETIRKQPSLLNITKASFNNAAIVIYQFKQSL